MPLSRAKWLSGPLGLLYVCGSLMANPAIHRCPHHDLASPGPEEAAMLVPVRTAPLHAGSPDPSGHSSPEAGEPRHHHGAGPCTCPGPCEAVVLVVPAPPPGMTWTGAAAPQSRAPADEDRGTRPLSLRYFLPPSTAPPSLG